MDLPSPKTTSPASTTSTSALSTSRQGTSSQENSEPVTTEPTNSPPEETTSLPDAITEGDRASTMLELHELDLPALPKPENIDSDNAIEPLKESPEEETQIIEIEPEVTDQSEETLSNQELQELVEEIAPEAQVEVHSEALPATVPPLTELPVQFYESIFDFCEVKNQETTSNQKDPSERVKFLTKLLRELNIPYILDAFQDYPEYPVTPSETKVPPPLPKEDGASRRSLLNPFGSNRSRSSIFRGYNFNSSYEKPHFFFNIILPGSSSEVLLAHHDIYNLRSDNGNDNSASVINAIAAKRLRPDLTVVLSDGEEPPFGGAGARRLARQIHAKVEPFTDIQGVINLELTGIGGRNVVVGDIDEPCTRHIDRYFGFPLIPTPPSDSTILLSAGIPSAVLVTLPALPRNERGQYEVRGDDGRYLDYKIIFRCHSMADSMDKIRPDDMKAFVEERLIPVLDSFAQSRTEQVEETPRDEAQDD